MALQSNDAPRPFILNRKLKNKNLGTANEKIIVEVDLINFGSSRALNSYLALSFKKGSTKEFYLSKPEMLVNGDIEKTLSITINLKEKPENSSLIETFRPKSRRVENNLSIMVFTNDFFGHYYAKKFKFKFDNTHLNESYTPFKQVNIFNIIFWEIKWFKYWAKAQENTFPQNVEKERQAIDKTEMSKEKGEKLARKRDDFINKKDE
ncbi:hypothetical protein Q9M42_02395 [Marinococcus luteus]|nr:hypothetical protein [Marinococcus luteus]